MKKALAVILAVFGLSVVLGLTFDHRLSLGGNQQVRADGVDEGSHFRYGSLRWVSIDSVTGEVEFRLTAAFRRDSNWGPVSTGAIITETQGPSTFNFGDGSATGTLRFLIISHDVSQNWVIGEALDPITSGIGIRHTYSSAGPFTAYIGGFASSPPLSNVGCCRVGQSGFPTTPPLNNRAGFSYPLQTPVTPFSGNSSPVSGLVPIVFVPQDAAAQFLVPASDPDGDSIRFRMSTDAEAGGCCHPPGMSINASTAVVTWNNLGLDTTNHWTAQVVIEDLDPSGNAKSKGVVDFLLKIVVGDPPSFENLPPEIPPPPCGQTLNASAGVLLQFIVAAQDPDTEQTVTLNHGGLPPGATFPIPVPANPGQSTFSWTPTDADVGPHIVTFTATDSLGLGSTPCSVVIIVIAVPLAIEKELLAGPGQIGIYLPEPTQYIFEIAYSNPDPESAVRIIDTVPAEFEILSLNASAGTAVFFDTSRGRGNSANRIEWDLPVGTTTATLTVEIQTVASPGRGHRAPLFKPTSCGPLPMNDGATAFEVDPGTGEIVRVEVVDPVTGEVTLEPVVIVGPSNALEVEAVEGAKPCVEVEEEEE